MVNLEDVKLLKTVLDTFPTARVEEIIDYVTGEHIKTGVKGGSMSKIDGLMIKTWNDKKFAEVSIDGRVFSVWNGFANLKIGDEVTGEIVEKGAGKTPQYKLATINGVAVAPPSGGYRGGGNAVPMAERIRPFATSYAKDVVVALINRKDDSVKDLSLIAGTFDYFFTIFLAKMDIKPEQKPE